MNSSDAKSLKLQGRAYTESAQDGKAVEAYRLSLADYSYDPETQNWLGIALDNFGLHVAAIESYGKAVEINLVYEKALYNRGMAHKQTGNFLRSLEDFTAVVNMKSSCQPEDYRSPPLSLGSRRSLTASPNTFTPNITRARQRPG